MHSILGWASFCMNYCINTAWHGDNQPVALLMCNGSTGCFDSGLQVICIVGSGVSHLPLDNTSDHHGLLIIPIHRLASSLCLLSTNKLVCGGRSSAIWLPSHHSGGCYTLVVVEDIPPFYVKRFEYPEKRYINVIHYYYYPIDSLWGSGQASLLANQAQ